MRIQLFFQDGEKSICGRTETKKRNYAGDLEDQSLLFEAEKNRAFSMKELMPKLRALL